MQRVPEFSVFQSCRSSVTGAILAASRARAANIRSLLTTLHRVVLALFVPRGNIASTGRLPLVLA